ncbi:MAG TPA: DNA methyltransferase [Candidatus Gastranaerophilales bacterium]|nr:DNA methyltransferase [Candidatus Gastranaerophilales bacterium]
MKTKKNSGTEAKLRLIDGNTVKKTKPYNDIDLNNWKEYDHINTGTLWMFNERAKNNGHKFDYHGNYIPQIAEQLYNRYTKPGDIILDLFLGSGTSAIEAVNLGRKCIGVEIKPDLTEKVRQKLKEIDQNNLTEVICENSASENLCLKINDVLEKLGNEKAQFLILHPPYADIIKFSDKKTDLSNCASTAEFLDKFAMVAENGYKCLENGRYAALIIGDKYSKGELVPLGFYCMQKMNEVGFKTKSIIVKNIEGNEIGKGKTNNLWRYRALAGGFYIFKHEYIMIFQKEKK